jgi:WD40 repeat protein/serine/threonine protein kinase
MTPEIERRDKLFDDALDREPSQRAAFLAEACADAPHLRAEVESLLAHHEQAEKRGFLRNPALSPVSPATIDDRREHAVDDGPEDSLEQALGPYTLKSLIGRGGFGAIYLAVRRDGQYQGRVAVKILKRGLDTDDILRRFLNERQMLAGLGKHPNIVTLLDGGSTADGRPYFVMEYVEGRPIDQQCDHYKLSIAERLRLFRTVCSAVHFAHKNLVVHRDLKPANILVTDKDDQGKYGVKLLDFGIAKFLNPELSAQTLAATAIGQRLLTPEYASPEQIRGDPINVTSDVYSLGVLLYELLTGHHPYRFNLKRSNYEKVVCEQDPEKPSTVITKVEEVTKADGSVVKITPAYVGERRKAGAVKLHRQLAGDLDNIVLKAMHKDPAQRYATVYELSQDIENYLEGNPVVARGNPFGYRSGKFVWKHKGKFSVAVLVFLALTGLAGWALAERSLAFAASFLAKNKQAEAEQAEAEAKKQQIKAEQAEKEAKKQQLAAELATAEVTRQKNRAEQHLYVARMTLAQQAWESAHIARLLELLSPYAPGQPQAHLRGFEWYYLWRVCHSELFSVPHSHEVYCVAFARGGQTMASATKNGSIMLWHWDGAAWQGSPLLQRNHPASGVLCLAFSSDGTRLVSGDVPGTLKLWDVENKKELHTLKMHKGSVRAVAFAPGDQKIVSGSEDGKVILWDVASRQALVTLDAGTKYVLSVALSPDGKTVAAGYLDHTIKFWDVATEKQTDPLVGHEGWVMSVAFSPDGQTLASASRDKTVILWDVATRNKLKQLKGHTGDINSLAFARDGRLATGSVDTTVRLWNIKTGAELSVHKAHLAAVKSVAFAPDGHTLASASLDMTVKLWRPTPEPASLKGHDTAVNSVAFSPDGRTLASASADKKVILWDVARGAKQLVLEGHKDRVTCVSFSTDGTIVATGSLDGTVKFWNASTGAELKTCKAHTIGVLCIAISPVDALLASGGNDSTVRFWDVARGKEQEHPFSSEKGAVFWSVAFSPDGKTLATAHSKLAAGPKPVEVVGLWDVATKEPRHNLLGHTMPITCVAFTPNGKLLASASKDKTVRIWDVSDLSKPPKLLMVLRHSSAVTSVAFAPDNNTLAAATQNEVILWDMATGEERASFRGHKADVWSVTFAASGRTLAAGHGDGMVSVWQAARD